MPTQTFKFNYSVKEQILTPHQLRSIYLYGIDTFDSNGNPLSDEAFQFFIDAAVAEIEGYLSVKLTKQVVQENRMYNREQFNVVGFVPTSFPVEKAFRLDGAINDIENIQFPEGWLSEKKSSDGTFWRRIAILPGNEKVTSFFSSTLPGFFPLQGYGYGSRSAGYALANNIADYWKVTYVSPGYGKFKDIVEAVGKLAAISVLHVLGDNPPGVGSGIAQRSISIDGLSESISSTQSATSAGFTARLSRYWDEMQKTVLPNLKSRYGYLGMQIL